jgi:hypothetical protein
MMAQQFCDDQGILFTCSTPGPYKIVIRKYKYANSSPTTDIIGTSLLRIW